MFFIHLSPMTLLLCVVCSVKERQLQGIVLHQPGLEWEALGGEITQYTGASPICYGLMKQFNCTACSGNQKESRSPLRDAFKSNFVLAYFFIATAYMATELSR